MDIYKWFTSSTGMSHIALLCSFLVLGSTYLSSNFKDKELKIERDKHKVEIEEKQSEIIALQNRIITEIKAPHFEIGTGVLLPQGKFQIIFRNVSTTYFRSFVLLLDGEYAIKDTEDFKTTPYTNKVETDAFKLNAVDLFKTLDPSEERILEVNLFPPGELEMLRSKFGGNSTILYNINVSPIVDSYYIKRDEDLKNDGVPHIGVAATINDFIAGKKFKAATYISRPDLEYNPENEIPRDAYLIISSKNR